MYRNLYENMGRCIETSEFKDTKCFFPIHWLRFDYIVSRVRGRRWRTQAQIALADPDTILCDHDIELSTQR